MIPLKEDSELDQQNLDNNSEVRLTLDDSECAQSEISYDTEDIRSTEKDGFMSRMFYSTWITSNQPLSKLGENGQMLKASPKGTNYFMSFS